MATPAQVMAPPAATPAEPVLPPVLTVPVSPNDSSVVAAPTVEPVVPPVVTQAAPVVERVDHVKSAVDKARKEERDKQYQKINELEAELGQARKDLRAKQSPDEQAQDLVKKLETLQATLNQTLESAANTQREHEREINRLRLMSHLQKRLREEREKGTELMIDLVGGQTEQEIDASIVFAATEYKRLESEFEARRLARLTPASPAHSSAPVAVSATAALQPSHFAAVPAPAAVVTDQADEFMTTVGATTTEEAVRSGAWQRARGKVLGTIRSSQVQAPIGVPFANMPRQQVADPRVVQPVALPTPPVMNPHAVQAPPNPSPIPSGDIQPVVAQPAPQPTANDPVSIARNHATRALANPAHANVTGVSRPAPREYAGKAITDVVFDGNHPMNRTTV